MTAEIKVEFIPSSSYSGNLYKQATTRKELDAFIRDAKDNVCAYRISVNGIPTYERRGNGAKNRWAVLK